MATAMEAALVGQVQRYLELYVYENARFLAERLVAHRPNEENALLLATCYYRKGQAARAAEVLSGATRAENRYLLACCCFQQNQLVEAENALLGGEKCHIDDLMQWRTFLRELPGCICWAESADVGTGGSRLWLASLRGAAKCLMWL
ncbi:Tetratricopeptide-like helical domain [Phytophthora cactorum]|nr:Tetratricopeptide-like helical domain [Phytophthora cactorum]